MTFFCEITVIYEKQKFSELDIVEFWSIETWSISYVTSVDIIAQVSLTIWSLFLFLHMPTPKLRMIIIITTTTTTTTTTIIIIIIILPTDWPEIILRTARTTKNKLPSR